ncbi:hypothetical protein AB0K74_47080 [Streptomyces sp. NPDC056159]|uniref:hypothetical protein n=1 Tax=Streptomyces sp. NPDC056159 TaxID=3155537 RepID=UPI003415F4E1
MSLTEEQREHVCVYAKDGADLHRTAKQLQDHGLSSEQAAETLPSVVNKCT